MIWCDRLVVGLFLLLSLFPIVGWVFQPDYSSEDMGYTLAGLALTAVAVWFPLRILDWIVTGQVRGKTGKAMRRFLFFILALIGGGAVGLVSAAIGAPAIVTTIGTVAVVCVLLVWLNDLETDSASGRPSA